MSSETEREALKPWKTVSVCGFDKLMAALDRAERKGYLPDAMAEEWDDFLWTEVDAAHPAKPPRTVTGDRVFATMLLSAAAKSGDLGTIEMAAQLAGATPCAECGYVRAHCRCGTVTGDGAGELLDQLCDSILWCDTATAKDLERFDTLRAAVAQALKGRDAEPATSTLTDEQIDKLWAEACRQERSTQQFVRSFARAVVAAFRPSAATSQKLRDDFDEALYALRELIEIRDLRRSHAAACAHAQQFPTDENYAVIDQIARQLQKRDAAAWETAREIVALHAAIRTASQP